MIALNMARENDRSRVLVDAGARLVVRDRARDFAAAVDLVPALVAEELRALGAGWYPIRAEIQKRTEGSGCRVVVVLQAPGRRPRFGSHATRAAARRSDIR